MNEIDNLILDLNNFRTRSAARKELVSLGQDKIGKYLISKVSDPGLVDNAVWAIAGIFAEWKYQESIEVLVNLLESRVSLQSDLARSLKTITGMDFGNDPEAWRGFLSGPSVFSSIRSVFNDDELLNFSVQDDFCKIYLPTPNNRKHEVLVYEKEGKLTVYTECGYILQSQVEAVKELSSKIDHSELVCENDDGRTKVTLTAEWSGVEINFELLKEQIKYFAAFADDLENQLTGEDNI